MKLLFILLVPLILISCATDTGRLHPAYIVAERVFDCDRIWKNVCVNGLTNEHDKLMLRLRSHFERLEFVSGHKYPPMISIALSKGSPNYNILFASYDYDFRTQFGQGVELQVEVAVDNGNIIVLKTLESYISG